ncbi:MAG: LamG domain-containing protein, partial [Planctomycetota bacterium]
PTGRWIHIASTYDRSAIKLYIDGRLADEKSSSSQINQGQHFWMARSDGDVYWTKDLHFKGKITEVRVYNRALTAEEIALHEATTNPVNSVEIFDIPVPTQNKLIVQLDKGGLGATPEGAIVDVNLFVVDSNNNPTGPAISSGSTDEFDSYDIGFVWLDMSGIQSGSYLIRAVGKDSQGQQLGIPNTKLITWQACLEFPYGPPGAKKLNNLVTELLNITGPNESATEYLFVNPRHGWVFISNDGSDSVQLTPQGGSPVNIQLNEKYRHSYEAMRLLDAGNYTISTSLADNLVVRAIPELVYAQYDSNPHVTEFGLYQNAFKETYHVLKNTNVFVGSASETFAQQWKTDGKRWLVCCSVPRGITVNEAYQYLVQHPAFNISYIDGLIADEFGGSDSDCAVWAEAIDQALSEPNYSDKVYHPYANSLWDGPEGRQLVSTLIDHNSAVAWKNYLKEQRSEEEAWQFLNQTLVYGAQQYRQVCSGSLNNINVCFGYFSSPPEMLDTFPHVNYKTYLDMQFHLAATHPAFDGLGGLMTYLANYADEETVRWAIRLFRHYGIEGNTQMLSDEPYILTHLDNPDFEQQGQGWTTAPAETNSIRFDRFPGFGWLQGRYPNTPEGDDVIVMRRSAVKPNLFSQQIKNLQPGQLYSFRMYSGDFNDLSVRELHAVSIDINNVTIIPKRSFTHINSNCYSHSYGPYDDVNKAWMNYHWRVFWADGNSATLTVSDWASDTEPGGSIGQELMFNFIEVQPYDLTPEDCNQVKEMGYLYTGDVTGDCKVDLADLARLALNWLKDTTPQPSQLNVSFDFTDGSWTPWVTEDLVDAGFVPNASVDATTEEPETSGNYFAVYTDPAYSAKQRMHLWLKVAVDDPPYPGATFAFNESATSGTVSGKWGVLGSANQDSFIALMAGDTMVGFVYPTSFSVGLNVDGYNGNPGNIVDTDDTGTYYIAYNNPLETRLSWTVNDDGTGGEVTGEVDFIATGADPNTMVTYSRTTTFLAIGVPDGIRIRTGWTSYVNRC